MTIACHEVHQQGALMLQLASNAVMSHEQASHKRSAVAEWLHERALEQALAQQGGIIQRPVQPLQVA